LNPLSEISFTVDRNEKVGQKTNLGVLNLDWDEEVGHQFARQAGKTNLVVKNLYHEK
jgi:hypothetical protein